MRTGNGHVNQLGVVTGERAQGLPVRQKLLVHRRGDEAVELFLLVSHSVLFDDNRAGQVLEELDTEVVGKTSLAVSDIGMHVVGVNGGSLRVSLVVGVDLLEEGSQITTVSLINRVEEHFGVSGELGRVTVENDVVLTEKCLQGVHVSCGDIIVFDDLVEDLFVDSNLSLDNLSSDTNELSELLDGAVKFSMRVSTLGSSLSNHEVLNDGIGVGQARECFSEASSTMCSKVLDVFALSKLLVDLVLLLLDLLDDTVELVENLNVVGLDGVVQFSASFVEFLELTRLSQSLDSVVGVVQKRSFSEHQVEVDFFVGVQVVILEVVSEEVDDLLLNFVLVGKSVLSNSELGREFEAPLHLIGKEGFVLSSVVLKTAGSLVDHGLGTFKDESTEHNTHELELRI